MKFYLALLSAKCDGIYIQTCHHAHFRPMDKYFTPFWHPTDGGFSHKENKLFCGV